MRASCVLLVMAALLATLDAASATTKVEADATKHLENSERFLRTHESTTTANWDDSDNEKDDEERAFSIPKALSFGRSSQQLSGAEKASQLLAAEKTYQKALSLEKAPAPNYFAFDDLTKMVDNFNFKVDQWEKWYRQGFTLGHIRQKLDLEQNPGFQTLLLDYINQYKSRVDELVLAPLEKAAKAAEAAKVEKVKKPNNVRFGENKETTTAEIDAIWEKALADIPKRRRRWWVFGS
ncbi:putative secreted RxLR effector protein [Phytophthora cinnamomi]|uniref:putative secreted RxLR effector protein n=1 Tax=Phytophthora cinnamomi TaxID=4785 RepID=UPI002A306F1B|nr:putative secreted RxLR effector protein [Phytophthora cinnamomi]KAJ8546895.1 hypothetical protein ON010_g11341 [Phytophthora cinnamomi]